MADDGIIRIGAQFDVAPLVAGAKLAGESTKELGSSISDLATRMKAQGLSSEEVRSALVNQQISTNEAAAATANMDSETAALTTSLNSQAVASESAAGGMRAIAASASETRVVTDLLTGNVSRAEQALVRMASHSATLGPILSAAFPIFGAVAFISILDTLADHIVSTTEAIEGWDKAAQKAYQDAATANLVLLRTNLQQQSEQQKQNEIGLEGIAKQRQSAQDLEADLHRYNAAAIEAQHAVVGIQAEIEKLKSERLEAAFDPTKFNYATLGKDIEDANKQLESQITLRDELTAKVLALKIETEGAQKTTAADQTRADIEAEIAKAAAVRTIKEAELAFAESVTKREYQEHRISLEQEVDELRTEEENKIQIIRDSVAAQQKELRARHAATGEDIGPKITALNAQQESEETAHQSRLDQIYADGVNERFRLDQAAALNRIDVDKSVAQAYDQTEITKAEIARKNADTLADIESSALQYKQAQTKSTQDNIAALQQEKTVLDQGPKNPQGGLSDPQEAQRYASINADIVTLERKLQDDILRIDADTKEKKDQILREQLSTESSAIEQGARNAIEGVEREAQATKAAYSDRSISSRSYLSQIQADAAKEYQIQAEAIAREMQETIAAGNADVLTAEQVSKRKQELWKEEAAANNRMQKQIQQAAEDAIKRQQESINRLAQQWSQDWSRMANDVITGREKIGVALAQLGQQMVLQLIDNGIQKVVTRTATALLTLLADHVKFLAQLLGIEVAGAAAKKAKDTAIAASEISASAGVAGAAGFASVMEALPFPLNVATAPGVMAAAIGTTLSNLGFVGAFEKGGVIPATGFALMHEGEGVLTAKQMMTINNSSSNSSRSVRTGPIRVTNNFPSSGGMSPDEVTAHVNRGIRRGTIKAGL